MQLAELAQRASQGLVIFLTGAGISAESGIPTFRGPEGYWTIGSQEYHPEELATGRAFAAMPEEVWAWYLYRRSVCRQAEPNRGHLALAELERYLGERFLLVTQNVDGLHLRAGNSCERIHEIHGNIDFMRCGADCHLDRYPIGDGIGSFARHQKVGVAELSVLRCPRCQGISRPHILWFDECYDEERYRFESCLLAAADCSVLISVGTSGATNLPMQMGALAARRGALLVDINPEDNPFAQVAKGSGGVWLRKKASEGLLEVAQILRKE